MSHDRSHGNATDFKATGLELALFPVKHDFWGTVAAGFWEDWTDDEKSGFSGKHSSYAPQSMTFVHPRGDDSPKHSPETTTFGACMRPSASHRPD